MLTPCNCWQWESEPLPSPTLRMLACEYLNTHLSAQLEGSGEYDPEMIDAEFRQAAQSQGFTFSDLRAECDQIVHEMMGEEISEYLRIYDGPDGWMEIEPLAN